MPSGLISIHEIYQTYFKKFITELYKIRVHVTIGDRRVTLACFLKAAVGGEERVAYEGSCGCYMHYSDYLFF